MGKFAAGSHGVLVTGTDQCQPLLLWMERLGCLAESGTAQVVRQWPPLSHRKDPGFFPRVVGYVGDIAGREDCIIVLHLQGVAYPEEVAFIKGEAGVFQPARASGAGYPEDFVHRQAVAGFGGQPLGLHLDHR